MPFPHGYAEDALYNAVNLCVHAVNNLRYALSLKMSIITSAMMEGNCAISGRKAKSGYTQTEGHFRTGGFCAQKYEG